MALDMNSMLESYKNHRKPNGVEITVEPCGLFVDSSEPWLEASPDGIVLKLFRTMNIIKAVWRYNVQFCVRLQMFAERRHHFALKIKMGSFLYRILMLIIIRSRPRCMWQSSLGVTVVWSAVGALFVQHVQYNGQFTSGAISKARSYYFIAYLPAVVPCVIIISEHNGS